MADKVTFELVSPERFVCEGAFDMVVVPGSEGDFAVLAGHAPMISSLRPGALEIYLGDTIDQRFFVSGGIAEVSPERLTVLSEDATPLAELDRSVVEQRIADAMDDVADARDDVSRDRAQEHLDHLQDILATL